MSLKMKYNEVQRVFVEFLKLEVIAEHSSESRPAGLSTVGY